MDPGERGVLCVMCWRDRLGFKRFWFDPYFFGRGGIQMNRYSIVEHVKARHTVVAWTASDLDRYWVYRPGQDCVESIGEGNWGLTSGVWVRGLAGIAALFPLFAGLPRYFCRHCQDRHDSDETAEWMLLAKVDRKITESEFRQLPMRLTHPKRYSEFISSDTGASQPQSSSR